MTDGINEDGLMIGSEEDEDENEDPSMDQRLFDASEVGDAESTIRLLLLDGANANISIETGNTPLQSQKFSSDCCHAQCTAVQQ